MFLRVDLTVFCQAYARHVERKLAASRLPDAHRSFGVDALCRYVAMYTAGGESAFPQRQRRSRRREPDAPLAAAASSAQAAATSQSRSTAMHMDPDVEAEEDEKQSEEL